MSSRPVTTIWISVGDVVEHEHVLQERRCSSTPAIDAAERALAAVEVDAAEQHGGDDGQFEPMPLSARALA